jgi:hypothetical protein
MTHSKMFEEIGCPKQLKKCQAELERQKKFIQKQSDIILALEKDIELKDNIILVLKINNLWLGIITLEKVMNIQNGIEIYKMIVLVI